MSEPLVIIAESDVDLDRCFPAMNELRSHLVQSQFVQRVRQQAQNGYCLAFLEENAEVRSVAGFRVSENLAWGKFLYVDDLVTRSRDRSLGYGEKLFDWLVEYAQSHACEQLHLDSGVQRFAAHRFYFKKYLEITSHHFAMKL